jgi:hypothetical protein
MTDLFQCQREPQTNKLTNTNNVIHVINLHINLLFSYMLTPCVYNNQHHPINIWIVSALLCLFPLCIKFVLFFVPRLFKSEIIGGNMQTDSWSTTALFFLPNKGFHQYSWPALNVYLLSVRQLDCKNVINTA